MMKMNQILRLIESLSHSQGFYGRLLESILELKQYNPGAYEQLVKDLESKNFKDDLDVIQFFEE